MAKSFKELVEKTSTENSKNIAEKRTEELLREYKLDKITWLDLYNFLYYKAHDFKNLGKFKWDSEVKVINPKTGEEFHIEPRLITQENKGELFCNPTIVLKLND
jgi:hypothetical protein